MNTILDKFVISQSQCLPCDPVNFSASPEYVESIIANPGECLCTNPCTVDKAAEFVRLYYIKRFVEDIFDGSARGSMDS